MPHTLLNRLREVRCDRQPFTPEHADCVCRLTNEAAGVIERVVLALGGGDGDDPVELAKRRMAEILAYEEHRK